ncbi:hypothetical protein KAR10_04995, partial [bacterium]|nr:hypothetical protein [bacterium]
MMKKIGLLLLVLGFITGMPLVTPAQERVEDELLALDEDTMNSILDELIGQMGADQAPASVKQVYVPETTAEKIPETETEEMLEESAMMIPPSSDVEGSLETPLDGEPTAVEPYIEQEFQAAEKVAAPSEYEIIEDLAEAEEPLEMEPAVAEGRPAMEMEGVAAEVEPMDWEDTAEAEPAAFTGVGDIDFQAIPETEGEVTSVSAFEELETEGEVTAFEEPETDESMFGSVEDITPAFEELETEGEVTSVSAFEELETEGEVT